MEQSSPDGKWTPALSIEGLDNNMIHAVGQLMINMSHTEAALRHLLGARCEIDWDVFDILTAQIKSNQVQEYLRKVIALKLDGSPISALMDEQFARISFIREKRNQLAHWIWTQHEDKLHIVKTPKVENPIPISVNDVRGWADELAIISMRLFICSLSDEQVAELVEASDYLSQNPNGEIEISLPGKFPGQSGVGRPPPSSDQTP